MNIPKKRTKMKSSYLTLLILAALLVGSDQHAAAGSAGLLQENPVLQASETDPTLTLFGNKGFDEEEKDDFADEKEDEMVGSTHHILKSFCAFFVRTLENLAIAECLSVPCPLHGCVSYPAFFDIVVKNSFTSCSS